MIVPSPSPRSSGGATPSGGIPSGKTDCAGSALRALERFARHVKRLMLHLPGAMRVTIACLPLFVDPVCRRKARQVARPCLVDELAKLAYRGRALNEALGLGSDLRTETVPPVWLTGKPEGNLQVLVLVLGR